MKKTTLISIITVSILVVLAGASVGLVYAFSPSNDSEISVVNVTTQSDNNTVTLVLKCEGNEEGNNHRFKRNFAYMHKLQFKNSVTGETLCEEQFQNQWRHRVQSGKNLSYQYQVEGLENGQMIQLRLEFNNGKALTYTFQVRN